MNTFDLWMSSWPARPQKILGERKDYPISKQGQVAGTFLSAHDGILMVIIHLFIIQFSLLLYKVFDEPLG